jgi:hypothetical protein
MPPKATNAGPLNGFKSDVEKLLLRAHEGQVCKKFS